MYWRNTKSRGGVAVYVKEGFIFQNIDVSHLCQESDLEIVCAKTKLKANADSIAAAPNRCKRAWELIHNSQQRRKPMSPEVNHLTPEIFSNLFASSVEEVRSSTGSSVATAMLYLQNMPGTVSANFRLKKVSCESQFGFRGGLSTVDAVGGLTEAVLNGFENRAGTVTTMCDVTKAFDCVPHDIILMKLEHNGVDGCSPVTSHHATTLQPTVQAGQPAVHPESTTRHRHVPLRVPSVPLRAVLEQ
ncbi:hypothetical protein J6590_068812 [Homalodisca vitripennis]|nr:hypothetical protein J6590_068812 [Homalodisca vitripennis]